MELIAGSKGTGKTQHAIDRLWEAVRMGRKCALFETAITKSQVKQRIIEGNFVNGIKTIQDRNANTPADDTDLDEMLHLEDPDVPVRLYCEKLTSPDDFLPLFGGRCATIGGNAAYPPLVIVDCLQDLPWFTGVSAASSFRLYLDIFQEIELNAGVEIAVTVQMLHQVNEAAHTAEEVREALSKTYPSADIDFLTICYRNFTDDFGRRRVEIEEIEL